MAAEDNIIVVMELGSSKVTALAGRKQADGTVRILAMAHEPSSTFIRKGSIDNIDKMVLCAGKLKSSLEDELQRTITQVYIGIGGMGMHTVANTVSRHLPQQAGVTQDVLDSMLDSNNSTSYPDRTILDVVPQEYKLGTRWQIDPLGTVTDSIEGHYLNIVARTRNYDLIRNCFSDAKIQLAEEPIIVARALANCILNDAEKRSGSVLVEMGAQTTTVSIYKNGLLRYLAVLPLGGENISRDISTTFQIDEDEAEELKKAYGSAYADRAVTEGKTISLRDGRTVSHTELNELVEARQEEIIKNIANQVSLSGYGNGQLIGGLIITGGASNMRDLEKAFSHYADFKKIRFFKGIRVSNESFMPDLNRDGSINSAIAVLDQATLNCCGRPLGEPEKEEEVIPEQPATEANNQANGSAEQETGNNNHEEEPSHTEKTSGKFKSMMQKLKKFMGDMVSDEDKK